MDEHPAKLRQDLAQLLPEPTGGHESQSRNDILIVVTAITAVIFLLTVLDGTRKADGDSPTSVGSNAEKTARSAPSERRSIEGRLWDRVDPNSGSMQRPPEAYQLPSIPGSRLSWHETNGGIESWGFVTNRNAREVGVSVLEHYEKLDGWELAFAETLGLWASSWGCTVYRKQSKEVVMVTALPQRLGETPGGERNPTRVSVLRVAGEEALRDVLGETGEPLR